MSHKIRIILYHPEHYIVNRKFCFVGYIDSAKDNGNEYHGMHFTVRDYLLRLQNFA